MTPEEKRRRLTVAPMTPSQLVPITGDQEPPALGLPRSIANGPTRRAATLQMTPSTSRDERWAFGKNAANWRERSAINLNNDRLMGVPEQKTSGSERGPITGMSGGLPPLGAFVSGDVTPLSEMPEFTGNDYRTMVRRSALGMPSPVARGNTVPSRELIGAGLDRYRKPSAAPSAAPDGIPMLPGANNPAERMTADLLSGEMPMAPGMFYAAGPAGSVTNVSGALADRVVRNAGELPDTEVRSQFIPLGGPGATSGINVAAPGARARMQQEGQDRLTGSWGPRQREQADARRALVNADAQAAAQGFVKPQVGEAGGQAFGMDREGRVTFAPQKPTIATMPDGTIITQDARGDMQTTRPYDSSRGEFGVEAAQVRANMEQIKALVNERQAMKARKFSEFAQPTPEMTAQIDAEIAKLDEQIAALSQQGGQGGQLTREEAMAYLQKAGGDANKAREMARRDGRIF